MPEFSIVKADWLPLLDLPARDRRALAAAILLGDLHSAPAAASLTKLNPAQQGYVREKCLQVSGKPAELKHALRALEPQPAHEKDRPLWEERLFLKAFAHSRLGEEKEAEAEFAQLPSRFRSRVQTERALRLLNQGSVTEAEALFTRARESLPELDPFSASTLLGGLTLAAISAGHFKTAEGALRERKHILKAHPSPTLAFGTTLYEILYSLEHNEFAEAEEKLRAATAEFEKRSVNGFFLLHLGLRLALARNELERAGDSLAELREIRRDLKLPEGVLDFRLEEIEWHLRSVRAKEARPLVNTLLAQALAKKDDHLRFRVGMLHALTLWLENEIPAALNEIENAIQVAELRHYRTTLSWAYFHAAGVALSAKQHLRAKLFLHRGLRLSQELKLPARGAAFSYLSEALEHRETRDGTRSLLSLAKHQRMGPELEYFLSAYQLLDRVALHVRQGRHQDVVDEPRLRQKLFREPGYFWFQREATLVANQGDGDITHLDLSAGEHQLLLFRLFWNAAQEGGTGLRLEDIHHARLTTPFRDHLHGPAAKMALSRLRSTLRRCGIGLEYAREARRYRLALPHPAYTIQSAAAGQRAQGARQREADILQRIAAESFVATQVLCEELQVSRQALHPLLKRLCSQGKLKLVRRGPTSGYVYRR